MNYVAATEDLCDKSEGDDGTCTTQPQRKRIPIIVDMDMDIYDMMALIVLLNNPDIEIKGITV